MMIKIALLLFVFTFKAHSQIFIETEHLPIAENRIPLKPSDLKIELDNPSRLTLNVEIDELSMGWVRNDCPFTDHCWAEKSILPQLRS